MATELAESRKYTSEQVDRALLVMALNGGNSLEAARQLQAQGSPVPSSTLRVWKTDLHAERYQSIQEREAKILEERLIAQQREVSLAASSASLLAVEAARTELAAGTTKDPARAAQALQTTAGIASDKMLTLQGRPVHITQTVDASDTLKRISTRFGGLIVDAEVVEDPAAGELLADTGTANARG